MMCNNEWMNESWSWYRCCIYEFLCSVLSLPFIFLTSSLSLIRTLCEIIIALVHMHMPMHVLCIRFLFVFLFLIYLCFHHTSYITYSNSLLLSLGSLFITINYQTHKLRFHSIPSSIWILNISSRHRYTTSTWIVKISIGSISIFCDINTCTNEWSHSLDSLTPLHNLQDHSFVLWCPCHLTLDVLQVRTFTVHSPFPEMNSVLVLRVSEWVGQSVSQLIDNVIILGTIFDLCNSANFTVGCISSFSLSNEWL